MAINIEMDQVFRKAMKLLHSSNSTSAAELRHMLDEMIKIRSGSEKMLSNILNKQQLEEESNFPGCRTTPAPQPTMKPEADEIINLTHSPTPDSDDAIEAGSSVVSGSIDVSGIADVIAVDDVNLKEFGDLNCCVCGEIIFTATNRLIECSKCGTLYHQECHKPPITDEEASEDRKLHWHCDTCSNKPTNNKSTSAATVVVIPDDPIPAVVAKPKSSATSSRSSSSSNSSLSFFRQEQTTGSTAHITTSSSKHHHHNHHKSSSSSSSNTKDERSSGSKSGLTPSINIISASEKGSSHSSSKKSSTHRSSSSSKSSSRSSHHESSSGSSKRKSK